MQHECCCIPMHALGHPLVSCRLSQLKSNTCVCSCCWYLHSYIAGKTRDCSVAGPLRRACALQNISCAMSSSARSDRDLSSAALPDPGSFDPKGLLRLLSWRLLSETSAESAPELSTARIDAPCTSPSSELDASVLCRFQESMILQITARTNEPMLLNQKLCDQA